MDGRRHPGDPGGRSPQPPRSRPAVLDRAVTVVIERREQLLYLVIGAWNTLFGYAVWLAMQVALAGRLHYLIITLMAWPIVVVNAYAGYRLIVFRSHAPIIPELARFSIVYVVTLAANLVVLPIALAILPWHLFAIQALFGITVIVVSYIANKYYSFASRRRGDAATTAGYDPASADRG